MSDPVPENNPAQAPVTRSSALWLGTWSLRGLSALLGPITLMVLAGFLWLWTGTEGSLGTALKWANYALPAGQHLHSSNVQGNLRQGGRVGQLQWRAPLLQVHARDTVIALDWSLLWRQPWPVQSLHLSALHIHDQRPTKPHKPWLDLNWPLPVEMALMVDEFQWQGASSVTLTDVQAHYAYDGQAHTLKVPSLTLADGQYTLQASLQGAAPMALKIDLQGQVKTPAQRGTHAVTLALLASVQGTLSGPQAQLAVNAELTPAPGQPTLMQGPKAVHLTLQADVRPWQQPAIVQAQGQWQSLNLAPLWPQAPVTHLSGHAHLKPDGQDWSLQAEMRNLQPGAWNLQRLPLAQLSLQAHRHQGQWQLMPSEAQLAGGKVQVQAQQSPAGWTASMSLTDIQPGQLHTGLIGNPIQGQLQGQWRDQVWQVDTLKLQARQATLESHFRFSPEQAWLQGQWALQLPGLRAKAEGRLAPLDGQGQVEIDVQDAAQSMTWLNTMPGWGALLQPFKATGTGKLKGQWQGGYAQANTPLQLDVQWPRLMWQTSQSASWVMEQSQLRVMGTPLSWQAQWQSHLGPNKPTFRVQAKLSAARPDLNSRQWSGQLNSFDVQNIGSNPQAGWRLQLQKTLAWQARLDRPALALDWSEAHWQMQGATPGNSRVQIEAGHWTSASPGQPSQARFAASWSDMPLNWLISAWGTDVQNDVLLQGQMQLTHNADTTLTAQIQRSRGDLRIQTDASAGQLTAAGLRDARLMLRVHNDQLQADLQWDSEHMGQARAQVLSTLSRTEQGWQWPTDAPLRGSVNARLPQIGAWSVLAPPGWRVQGTLDAEFDLAGTRSQPQWQGRLQASQLAARSAVQGIAFDRGLMQARLQGQELILEQLSFRGAGPQGGEILARGQISLAPSTPQVPHRNANPLQSVQMNVQVEAKSLRVSHRADRRLLMSGQVSARTEAGQMQIRGLLKADQALFLLPEENTPRLGDDVVVMRPSSGPPHGTRVSSHQVPTESWMGVPNVRVTLDLGPDFQLQGKGLNTRLAGQVELVSNASTQGLPRLTGQVRTVGGRYKAYGQQLNISTGVLRFNGAHDNPGLEILALRPHLPQPVGVQVSGTALLPRIRLYADPDMPDGDKLAWLVLGRSAASGGAESAVLQQAAMALLSSNGKTLGSELAGNLGLDEISLATSSRTGVNATGAAVTLGKRLSQDFYMAYETSLSGTMGSLFIFYDLSQRLTLRAQAGEQSALDMIFRIRRD